MNIIEPFFLGLVLSVDSFSAAVALGIRPHKIQDALKFAVTSAAAEALMTFLGVMIGAKIIAQYSAIDHWLAFILLAAVALHMAYEGFLELRSNDPQKSVHFHGIIKIIVVSFATSIDAFAVGVSLGLTHKNLFVYLTSITAWAFASTMLGMSIGKKAPKKLSTVFNFFGALIIFILALKMVQI